MTDPIADFLTRIRNALLARHRDVSIPASNTKRRLAYILKDEGYINDVSETDDSTQGTLHLALRWGDNNTPAITQIKRISRPGQRAYVAVTDIPVVRQGLGTAILSTSKGVMTDRQARKQNVGGEILCEIW